jgi:plasmid stabilization system protein ParE
MSLKVRFLPESRAEFDAAVDWYKERGADLAKDFVARVRAVIKQVAATPRMHATVHGDVRKAIVGRFPYVVLYREDAGELVVVSVFHTSRDPAEWQSRVE